MRTRVVYVLTGALVLASRICAGTIGATSVNPTSLQAGVGTPVTVTATITDPSLIASSVNVQQLDAAGRATVLGTMHDDGLAGDTVAGDKIFSFQTNIFQPNPGSITLRVSAGFLGSLLRVFSPPMTISITGTGTGITITTPAASAYLNTSPVLVTGTVTDPNAQVTVNGIAAPNSAGQFSASVPLQEGPNTITAVANNSNGTSTTASRVVTLDTTPPHIMIDSPANNAMTTESSITVTGLVNDIVVGTVNNQQATVNVNGVPATVVNRTFTASNVPLNLGPNTIQAMGRDRAGNGATATIIANRQPLTQPRIRIVSGNNLSAPIKTLLASPLVVQLVNGSGQGIPNTPVVFRATGGDGSVTPSGTAGMSSTAVNTNTQGQAQVYLIMGSRAGAGNNVIEASSAGIATTAVFTESGTTTAPAMILVDSGNSQAGVVGQPLPLPFIAIVTDAGHNRLGNVPVTFAVKQGGGNINGQPSFTTQSDSDGRVQAVLTLGPLDGTGNNQVQATFSGNSGLPATFVASGRIPGPAQNTLISGVVLDNSNVPIPGVTMRLFQTNQGNNSNIPQQVVTPVQTDAQGYFQIHPAPVGVFKLMADGTTAQRPGSFPTLEYDIVTVSGQNNTVGLPIYLPLLNPASQLCVSPTTGGTLTIPQAPGFALTITAGSATFPGGARSGCVSVTPVNMDKVPMVPGFGQQPRFIVTIQPVGTTFNPPAAITIPNVDGLAPRAVTEMYSYDHDLASFVAIGTGTVSADGSVIASDPGVGVLKAGWHCGGNPNANGTVADCPDCKICQNNACVPDPAQNNHPCQSGAGCCSGGTCNILPTAVPAGRNAFTYTESIILPTSGNWGETDAKRINVDITSYFDPGSNSWKAKVTTADEPYTIWFRLLPGVSEASVAAATQANQCKMISDLSSLGNNPGPQWYMVAAVEGHERQHVIEIHQSLDPQFAAMKAAIEGLSVPNDCTLTAATAAAAIKAVPGFNNAVNTAYNNFRGIFDPIPDPNANTDAAEHAVVDPMVAAIRAKAIANGWPACP